MAMDFQNHLKDEGKVVATNDGKKRGAVCDNGKQGVTEGAGEYVPKVVDKPPKIREMILSIVASTVLFSSYTYDEQNAIVDAFDTQTVDVGDFVIRQGAAGDTFYIIESGTLEVYVKSPDGIDQKVGGNLGAGKAFGELALMYNTPRAASIKALTKCTLWTIDRPTYRGIVVQYKYMRNKIYLGFLREVEIMGKKLGVMMSDGM